MPRSNWAQEGGGRAEKADNPPPRALSPSEAPVEGELRDRARRATPQNPWVCPQERESTWAKVTSAVKNTQRVRAKWRRERVLTLVRVLVLLRLLA